MRTRLLWIVALTGACAHPAAVPGARAVHDRQHDRQHDRPEVANTRVAPPFLADPDRETDALTELLATWEPEGRDDLGLRGDDARISDPSDVAAERYLKAMQGALARLQDATAGTLGERADLEVLKGALQTRVDTLTETVMHRVPLLDPHGTIIRGLSAFPPANEMREAQRRLLAEKVAAYAGLAPKDDRDTSWCSRATQRMRKAMQQPGREWPARALVARAIGASKALRDELWKRWSHLAPREFEALDMQLAAFVSFLSDEVLARCPEKPAVSRSGYEVQLRSHGIDAPALQLAADARDAFRATQHEMTLVAARIATRRGLSTREPLAVLRALRGPARTDEATLALYRQRSDEVDALLRRAGVVSLPDAPLSIRLAGQDDEARLAAPHYVPPSLMGGATDTGVFVLPRGTPDGGATDDFSSDAASWWLLAHEGRPGHDLQYATIARSSVSRARRLFGFNNALAEGWGLYAEGLLLPWLSEEAQLATLQARLMREAHAFLDIEVNLGLLQADDVRRIMRDEVGMSDTWAKLCVQRYTMIWPGQAVSYFYGARALTQLREQVQRRQGASFRAKAFHDAVLAQGPVPLATLSRMMLGPP